MNEKVFETLNLSKQLKPAIQKTFSDCGLAVEGPEAERNLTFVLNECLVDCRREEARAAVEDDALMKGFILKTALSLISERTRQVETPVGRLVAYPKRSGPPDYPDEFPGINVDLLREGEDSLPLACVEWISLPTACLETSVYGDGAEDVPTEVITHWNLDAE